MTTTRPPLFRLRWLTPGFAACLLGTACAAPAGSVAARPSASAATAAASTTSDSNSSSSSSSSSNPAPTAPVVATAADHKAPRAANAADPALSSPQRKTPDAPFRAEAPGPAPESPYRVPPFKRFRLRTGVEVLLAEFHELPLIELHLVLKTGGAANPVGSAGLADLTANMLDEGTKTRSALDIAEQIASLGSVLGSGASWDASTLTLATIARNFDAALAIWADVLLHPAFSEKELARVRDNLATAVARRKDSPPTVASLTLARVLYGDKHPYAWPQTGTEESLEKLGTAEVRKFYETYYHPGNATIIVAGDVTEAQLRRKLEAALREWKPARVPAIKLSSPPVAEKKKIFLIDKPGAPQSSIRVGLVGVKRTDPDYFPIVLMNQVLGGSFYRLDMDLRERLQWTYGARSSFEMRRTPGPFSAGGEFVAAHTADAVAEILKEMRLMSTTEVSDEELARAKDNFIRSFPARFATRGSTAGVLAELAVYGLPDRFLTDYAKNIQAVTKAEVRRVAAKYLLTERSAIVVVGDRASQEAGLARLAPIEVRDLDGGPLVARPKGAESTTESPASKSEGGGAQD